MTRIRLIVSSLALVLAPSLLSAQSALGRAALSDNGGNSTSCERFTYTLSGTVSCNSPAANAPTRSASVTYSPTGGTATTDLATPVGFTNSMALAEALTYDGVHFLPGALTPTEIFVYFRFTSDIDLTTEAAAAEAWTYAYFDFGFNRLSAYSYQSQQGNIAPFRSSYTTGHFTTGSSYSTAIFSGFVSGLAFNTSVTSQTKLYGSGPTSHASATAGFELVGFDLARNGTVLEDTHCWFESGAACNMGVDIPVTATPEPATWALMASGLAGVAFISRKRRKTTA